MDPKLLLCVLILMLTLHQNVEADFFYNRVVPKQDELGDFDLKCVPGRTILKMEQQELKESTNDEEHDSGEYLRSHMRWQTEDTYCQICICDVEGKDEYCSKRPAMNVNECIRMAALKDKFQRNDPFEHEKSLAFRIRRDYIWHNDEIPYEAKAKCRRGHSYYSNSINANDTDIDVASDVNSLLDYNNEGICYYCVCTVDGNSAGCLSRSPWFCEYFRFIRQGDASRDIYTTLFKQDRPKYFRSLSWRLRRTMDSAMFDLMESVGSEKKTELCVPFVSEYTDCTEDNLCSGCSKCTCTADANWSCKNIQECADEEGDFKNFDDNDIDEALQLLEREYKEKEIKDQAASNFPLVPGPEKMQDLLLEEKEVDMEDEILALMRSKRSVGEKVKRSHKKNDTIKFYNAVDEINEDTLKVTNVSGTLLAQKVDTLPQILRRTNMLTNSTSNTLQIQYPPPKNTENNHHDDNKVDTTAIHDDKEDLMVHSNIYEVVGNHSQTSKDRELSKLLVNELKGGNSEIIGDKTAPVISNITFTPENDTLTAMAFIAGNLLNKLWNMEKDASDDHIDTEVLKHEKIANLLELFQEPLSMRQEAFLKNALKQLSTALNQNKNIENVSLCKTIREEEKTILLNADNRENKPTDRTETDCDSGKKDNKSTATTKALNEINNVLDLIKKYENVQNSLSNMKSGKVSDSLRSDNIDLQKTLTKDEKSSLDLYGRTLETITKLLIPNHKNNKVVKSIQNDNLFKTEKNLESKLSDMNLGNMNITTKDKMILDYLAHIQSNPNCLLKRNTDKVSLPLIEGNILLNLSEFFKIKSLSDLVKLTEPKELPKSISRSQDATTQKPVIVQTTKFIEKDNPKQFKDTKDKLKGHLKSILEDLMELQKIEGKDTKSKDIMEALPCIYNLLNAGNKEILESKIAIQNNTSSTNTRPSNKIREIFHTLKNELKFAQTRRSNSLTGPRPKSAVVWERVIKNAERKRKVQTRRNFDETPKNIEELKAFLEQIEPSGSNTYKNYAYLHEVPPAERLLLLKTFSADTARYIKSVKKIMTILDAKTSLSQECVKEFDEYLDNVAVNINLNEKVVKNLDKPKIINKSSTYSNIFNPKSLMKIKSEPKLEQPFVPETNPYDSKLSRDQIINQLIKNRIILYIRSKDAARETYNDMNYDIAKKILLYLEVGNIQLARELYKVFTDNKQNNFANVENKNIGFTRKQSRLPIRRNPYKMEPLIKFEDSTPITKAQIVNQDHFIKQLLNLKNIKF